MNIKHLSLRTLCVTWGLLALTCHYAFAQFQFNGQLVQRSEYRHGYGSQTSENQDPALFISQRLRLQGEYKIDKVEFKVSIQDIRTWGSTPQLKISDNFLSLYEGWAKINFTDHFAIKLGRQELNYDNARFLGNVDWTLQGRTHDVAMMQYQKGANKLDVAFAYNQNGEKLTGNVYTDPNQYKTAVMARYESKIRLFSYSALFWLDGRQYTVNDSIGNLIDKGIRNSYTLGFPTLKYDFKNLTLSGFYYHQLGKTVNNKVLNAFNASLQASYAPVIQDKNQIRVTAGGEILSGTSDKAKAAYNPLYGTNHMHNGYMDYFYVGGRNNKGYGLIDLYAKVKYDISPKFFLALNGHSFRSYEKIKEANGNTGKYLGTELDLTAGYVLTKSISFQGGYSQMFADSRLDYINEITNASNYQSWAYVMILIRPGSDKKFISVNN